MNPGYANPLVRPFQFVAPSDNPIENLISSPIGNYGPTTLGGARSNPFTASNGTADQSAIQKALAFLGTPGGQAVTGFAGAGLSALGNAQEANANRQQNATQYAATSAQNQFNADRADANAKATGVLNADPLGADQKYAQRNALASAILPQLRNARSTPGDAGVAGAMGSRTGGLSNILPQGGLDPAMVKSMFGTDATASAIAQRHNEINSLDPNAAQPDMAVLFGPAGAPYQAQMKDWASKLQNASAQTRAAYDAQMKGYIDHMVSQESESGGFWHTFAKIAGVVGAAAATIMTAGGASPLLVGAVGAGAGASSAFGNNSNPLMGAIMGGATSYAGAKVAGKS